MSRLSVRPSSFSLRTSVLNGAASRPSDAARSGARTAGRSAMRRSTVAVHGPVGIARPVGVVLGDLADIDGVDRVDRQLADRCALPAPGLGGGSTPAAEG